MTKLFAFLSGKKTYIAAAGWAALAIYQLTEGNTAQAGEYALAAATAAGLRHAVGTASSDTPAAPAAVVEAKPGV